MPPETIWGVSASAFWWGVANTTAPGAGQLRLRTVNQEERMLGACSQRPTAPDAPRGIGCLQTERSLDNRAIGKPRM